MKRATVRDLRYAFPTVEAALAEGEEIEIVKRNKVIARLVPVAPTARPVWEGARRLSLAHSATLGTRSPDILQVATALALKADTFLTFDRNQSILAQAEGLATPVGSE